MTNWQPISTAPRDGTNIIVWNGFTGIYVSSYDPTSKTWPAGYLSGYFGRFYPEPGWWLPLDVLPPLPPPEVRDAAINRQEPKP